MQVMNNIEGLLNQEKISYQFPQVSRQFYTWLACQSKNKECFRDTILANKKTPLTIQEPPASTSSGRLKETRDFNNCISDIQFKIDLIATLDKNKNV